MLRSYDFFTFSIKMEHFSQCYVCDCSQNTLPEYTSVTDNCTYRFVWSVRAACPTDVQPVAGENCAVTDPTSGMITLSDTFHLKAASKVDDNRFCFMWSYQLFKILHLHNHWETLNIGVLNVTVVFIWTADVCVCTVLNIYDVSSFHIS